MNSIEETKKNETFQDCVNFAKRVCEQVDEYLSKCTETGGHRGAAMSIVTYELLKRLLVECGDLDAGADVLEDLANTAFNDVFKTGVEFNTTKEPVH